MSIDDSNYDKSYSCILTIRVNTDRMANLHKSDLSIFEFADHSRITIHELFVICKFMVIRVNLKIVYSRLERDQRWNVKKLFHKQSKYDKLYPVAWLWAIRKWTGITICVKKWQTANRHKSLSLYTMHEFDQILNLWFA